MIPKVIHYCWFSGDEFPEDVRRCIESWKKYLPDYEIVEWNADNFDVNMCAYTREAFEKKKWAFLSDYARLWILYNYGGIYLDSDIEVFKSFDELLNNHAFSGFESENAIAAWIFGSEKGNPIMKELLDYYDGRSFLLPNGEMDLTPNPIPVTNILKQHGLECNNQLQRLDGDLFTVYPRTYFCPKTPHEKKVCFSENTYAMHLFLGAWLSEEQRKRRESRLWAVVHFAAILVKKIFGEKFYLKLKTIIKL